MKYFILILTLTLFSCGSVKQVAKTSDKETVKTAVDSTFKKTESVKETEVKTDSSVVVTDEVITTDFKEVKGKDSSVIAIPDKQVIQRHTTEKKAIKTDNKSDKVGTSEGTVNRTNQDTKDKSTTTKEIKHNGFFTSGNIAIIMAVAGALLAFFLFLKFRKKT